MAAEVAQHVAISGRVQGVGYRAWVQDRAIELGLRGWVRNRRDGSVEAVFAGDASVMNAALRECNRGPLAAKPTKVEAREASDDELALIKAGERFSVLPTA